MTENKKTNTRISDLYKNVTMASSSVKSLMPYVKDKTFQKVLNKQTEQYDGFAEKIEVLGDEIDFDPTPVPKAWQTMVDMGIRAKMIADDSQEHAAKIMIQGTLDGVIDLYRQLKDINDVNDDVVALTKQVLHYEESVMDQLKCWL